MSNHNCPSCGFLHTSEGDEVPELVIQQLAPATGREIVQVVRAKMEQYQLTDGAPINALLTAAEAEDRREQPAEEPAPGPSVCPICGPDFTSSDTAEFHAHMVGHMPKEEPAEDVPALTRGTAADHLEAAPGWSQCPICGPNFTSDDPDAFNAHMVAGEHKPYRDEAAPSAPLDIEVSK